jgi:hypothetical protein
MLIGLFVVLGTGVLYDLATRYLPTHSERVTILGRDTHQTMLPNLATRIHEFTSIRQITLADVDGKPFTIDAPKALYDRAFPGLMMEGMSVSVRRSVLFDRPVALEITEGPIADLGEFPALSRLLDTSESEAPDQVTTYDLRLPYILSIGWLALLGLMTWVMIRLPHKDQFVWPLFGGGMAISVALGTWWWTA